MRVLILSGSGFLGSAVALQLQQNHDVAVFHRGTDCAGVYGQAHIHGDLARLHRHRAAMRTFSPDAIIDMSPRNGAHASHVIDMLAPLCNRFVCISSASVYRTFGRLVGTEKAPIDNEPQTEAAPLRSKLYPYAGATPRAADDPRAWLDTYDKIPAEQAYLEEAAISVSIVRMPLLYGPGDPDTRVARFRLSMLAPAGRVILRRDAFGWRNSRCGIANAAEAVALVAERANGGEIYNVAEQEDYCEADWIGMIGSIIGWRGHLEPAHLSDPDGLPLEDIPIHADFSQHLRLDSGRIRQDLGYRESESPLAGLRKALGMAA